MQERLLAGDGEDDELGLKQMSKHNQIQYVSANTMGTISAGLAVAAVATLEVPPVAIALGLGSLGARLARDAGDSAADAVRRGGMATVVNEHKRELQGFLSVCDEWAEWNRTAAAIMNRPLLDHLNARRRLFEVPDDKIPSSAKAGLVHLYAKLDGKQCQGISLGELQQLMGQDVEQLDDQLHDRRLDIFEFALTVFAMLEGLPPQDYDARLAELLEHAPLVTDRGNAPTLEPDAAASGAALTGRAAALPRAAEPTAGAELAGVLRSAATTSMIMADDVAVGASAAATGLAEAGAVLGVVGAVFAVGFAAHEWREIKPAHAIVAAKIVELERSNLLLRKALGITEADSESACNGNEDTPLLQSDDSAGSGRQGKRGLVQTRAKSLVDGATAGAAKSLRGAKSRLTARSQSLVSAIDDHGNSAKWRLTERSQSLVNALDGANMGTVGVRGRAKSLIGLGHDTNAEESRLERRRALTTKVTQFYEEHNAAKLHQVERVCAMYLDSEAELNSKLRELYGADLTSIDDSNYGEKHGV